MSSDLDSVFENFLSLLRPDLAARYSDQWPEISFTQLALDSLDQTTLCLDIEDAVGAEVRVDELSGFNTLGDLKEWVLLHGSLPDAD